jgi:hypothetical protein
VIDSNLNVDDATAVDLAAVPNIKPKRSVFDIFAKKNRRSSTLYQYILSKYFSIA